MLLIQSFLDKKHSRFEKILTDHVVITTSIKQLLFSAIITVSHSSLPPAEEIVPEVPENDRPQIVLHGYAQFNFSISVIQTSEIPDVVRVEVKIFTFIV